MKKIVILMIVVSVLTLALTTFVFAANNSDNIPQWFKDMITWRKTQIDQAVKDGTITQAEADSYKSRIDQMQKWHEQNGFGPGMGAGGCGGRQGFGMMGRNSTGYGMMNGFYKQ